MGILGQRKYKAPLFIRRYFLYDRKLLSELSRCAWETLKECFQEAVPEEDAVSRSGGIAAIHSFGDFLGWHPHLHILCIPRCAGFLWRRSCRGIPRGPVV